MFITEWGYTTRPPAPTSTTPLDHLGQDFQTTVDGDGASWTAWVTDNAWTPSMFADTALTKLTNFGTLVKTWLAATPTATGSSEAVMTGGPVPCLLLRALAITLLAVSAQHAARAQEVTPEAPLQTTAPEVTPPDSAAPSVEVVAGTRASAPNAVPTPVAPAPPAQPAAASPSRRGGRAPVEHRPPVHE